MPDDDPVVLQGSGVSFRRRTEGESPYINDQTVGRRFNIESGRPRFEQPTRSDRTGLLLIFPQLVVHEVGVVGGGHVAAVELSLRSDVPQVVRVHW